MIYRLAVLFVALSLGSCLEKVQDEDPEKLVTLQVLLNSDKITRSVPTEPERQSIQSGYMHIERIQAARSVIITEVDLLTNRSLLIWLSL